MDQQGNRKHQKIYQGFAEYASWEENDDDSDKMRG